MLYFPGRRGCVCALLWAAGAALADDSPAPAAQAQVPPLRALASASLFVASAWHAVDDAVLERLRGGFELSSLGAGLAVSFGFVRSVVINGDLVSQTRFSLPDLAHISNDQARLVSDALAQAHVVQNGLGNSVGAGELPASLAATTVVQNSLNNQHIQTLTQIDAGVNSLGLLRSMNAQGALRDALMGAARLR